MPKTLTQKIIDAHIVEKTDSEYGIRIDQTITQDATGTLVYLEFEATGIPSVATQLSVSYVDHNTLQTGFENADDHKFLQDMAYKYGIYFSKPGGGICHQVHLERFSVPGQTLLGSDSHTPTAGGIGMLAIGAGGIDVAAAMAGMPFYIPIPKVVNVVLNSRLKEWVSAKDIILEVLRHLSVKGGVGKILEYTGDGIKSLSVPERATITNMGAETGATTSIFPSDDVTRAFLSAQDRSQSWQYLTPDKLASYDATLEIDLSRIEPMVACPHSPDDVRPVRDIEGKPVDQVVIGSCTNSSLKDLLVVASVLKGKKVHPDVDLAISPGSRQVLMMLASTGALVDMVSAGARILECACGPCIGMGLAPRTNGVSVRTFNRNFKGRSGTLTADVYLASPEVAVACAINGKITDPRELGTYPKIHLPKKFLIDDSMIIPPAKKVNKDIKVTRGPNIKSLPIRCALEDTIEIEAILKLGDNITTDDIIPAGSKILPLRSNIPEISRYVFSRIDKDFSKRAQKEKASCIIAGNNYGQGSSREHAAACPMYLGIRAVFARSFARIHRSNLINFGIIPVTIDERAYETIQQGQRIRIGNILNPIAGKGALKVHSLSSDEKINCKIDLSGREAAILKAGGLLNYIKKKMRK